MYVTPSHHKYSDMRPDFIKQGLKCTLLVLAYLPVSLLLKFRLKTEKGFYSYFNSQIPDIQSYLKQLYAWGCISQHESGIFLSKENNNDGDVCAYAGLLSISGHGLGKSTSRRCQGPDGRFWRSPARINNDSENSFSRDQLLGVFGYFIAEKDIDSANKYIEYLRKNNWKMCDNCTDGRCDLRLTSKGMFWRVSRFVGFKVPLSWYFINLFDRIGQLFSAYCSKTGYRIELVAENILLNSYIGQRSIWDELAAREISRRQPDNPFYEFVRHGRSKRLVDLIRKYRPLKKPILRDTWVFAPPTEERKWDRTMVWDWVFLLWLIDIENCSNI